MSENPQQPTGGSGSVSVTDRSAFTEKSLGKQVLFSVVTFGLYSIYWTYTTGSQLDNGTDQNVTPILIFIPIIGLLAIWQMSQAADAVTDQDGLLLFLAFLVFSPIAWYLIQSGINEVAAN